MKSEEFDQYQIMIDGWRRLTRRNRRYLRLFTPFQPNMTVPCRQAAAVKPTAPLPATNLNQQQKEPVEV